MSEGASECANALVLVFDSHPTDTARGRDKSINQEGERERAIERAREAARVRVRAQGRAHASEVKRENELLDTHTNITQEA